MPPLVDLQLDGLPGPTHHFGGMSLGNLASQEHANRRSSPRAAARQGLAKMRLLLELGACQALLPPLERPDLGLLRACGLEGDDASVLAAAASQPELLQLASSSAFMWTANCATVVPSADSSDRRLHLVCANLMAMSHRAREGVARASQLRQLLGAMPGASVHDPLPPLLALGDEGAANHTRLCGDDGIGMHLFVYGRGEPAGDAAGSGPRRLPARHTLAASMAVARLGRLDGTRVLFARQHPAAIDAGAFHNDVVMVGDGGLLLLHQTALVDQPAVLAELAARVPGLRVAEIAEGELPLAEAVRSYLFNSQLIATAAGTVLVAPSQASEGRAGASLRRLVEQGVVARIAYVDLGESMANGGGPACLRLRLPLTAAELNAFPAGLRLDHQRIALLEGWVDQYYRDRLLPGDLHDPALIDEGRRALAELNRLLALPPPGGIQG
jgi:succinylarginine dihydrolase